MATHTHAAASQQLSQELIGRNADDTADVYEEWAHPECWCGYIFPQKDYVRTYEK
jgi:hypothetical protein